MIHALIQNLHHWDQMLCLQIFAFNGRKTTDRIMVFATRLGDGYIYPLIGMFIIILNPVMIKSLVPAALIAFAIELPGHKLLKQTIRRTRPCHILPQIKNLVSLPDEFSFPSGHTASAFLMATVISTFYPALIIPNFLMAALIGLSRIYNGVHYPGDVIVGSLIGIISAKIGLIIVM